MLQESTALEIAGYSDPGLAREHNEDCIGFDSSRGIAILADGMGGHQAGEVASRMAVDDLLYSLSEQMRADSRSFSAPAQMFELVCSTIAVSNRRIYEAAEANSGQTGMGTTIIAAVLQGKYLYAGHVGDSRLYLFREGKLRRITRDHSLIQDLIDKGFYTEDEARGAAISHVVTRALGTTAEVEVDLIQQATCHEDVFLLCSDGLTDMLDDRQIEEVLLENCSSLESSARNLIKVANFQGGKDNISVILMRVQHVTGIQAKPQDRSVSESIIKLSG
ncbi:MAG: Stp1/IreP family PP2C-type Ser/Thr phosphatase [Pseudohongiellaceae bacterium]